MGLYRKDGCSVVGAGTLSATVCELWTPFDCAEVGAEEAEEAVVAAERAVILEPLTVCASDTVGIAGETGGTCTDAVFGDVLRA